MQLKKIGEEIWTYEGITVSFYGFPYSTRMTVVRLRQQELWIHSPEKWNEALRQELAALGTVKYLIAPNKLHHLFLPEWLEAYPDAKNYAAPGLIKKRPDILFDAELTDKAEVAWQAEIQQVIFHGSPFMEEVVFYHARSKSLIVADLIENFRPEHLNAWQRKLAQWGGILYPNGKMPIDWRISFNFGSKEKARQALAIMESWQPDNIVLCHGQCIEGNAMNHLQLAFKWLG